MGQIRRNARSNGSRFQDVSINSGRVNVCSNIPLYYTVTVKTELII